MWYDLIIMVTLQVKDIPEEMYERLRVLASERKTSVDATVREVLEWELKNAEWWRHWKTLPRTDRVINAAELIRESRTLRENGLE